MFCQGKKNLYSCIILVSRTRRRKKNGKCICDKVKLLRRITGNPKPLHVTEINKVRLNLFTVRNSDGSGHLILQGKDIYDRYKRRICDSDIRAIVLYVREASRRITKIDLCYNEITDNGFIKLLKRLLIKGRSSVIELDIMNNDLTFKAVESLAKYAKFIKLKKLRLNGNVLGTESGKFLARLFKGNDTIEYCDLGETGQTLTSLAEIVAAFRNDNDGNTTVKVLDLSRVVPLFNRYPYESKWLVYHMEFLLERNSVLTELHLQKNQFIAHDMEYLVRGLKRNRSLLYLDLGFNRIGDYGAELLAKYLLGNPQLLLLNVAGNDIGDIGARALSFGMPYSKIRALDVSKNVISDQGVVDLLNTIKKKFKLKFFNLWGNEIGQRSCEVIKRMLMSGALVQSNIDVKIYEVDGKLFAAYYTVDRSKHFYYCELDFGYAQPIYRIKINPLTETKNTKADAYETSCEKN